MKKIYTAHAFTIAGREGHSETDDKQISVDLAKPGSGKPGTNPEQLFACAYSACFGGAIDAIAKKQNVQISKIKVNAEVSLNQGDIDEYFLSVILDVTLEGIEAALTQSLVEKAHNVCPYSKATRDNIEVILKIDGKTFEYSKAE